MPSQNSIFRSSGSKDDLNIETTGFEMFKILKYHKHRFLLILSFIASCAEGVISLLFIITMNGMMDIMTGSGNFLDEVTDTIVDMAIIQAVSVIVMSLSLLIRVIANTPFIIDLRKLLYNQFLNLEIDYFDQTPTGVMISRLSEDVMILRETYIDKGCQVCQNVVQTIAGIVFCFVTNWFVSVAAIVIIPLIGLIFYFSEVMIDKLWQEYSSAATSSTAKAEEIITQFRTIKSFDCELKEYYDYEKGLNGVDQIFKKTSIAHGLKNGIITFLANGLMAVIIYMSCYFILHPESKYTFELGGMLNVFMSAFFAIKGLSQAVTFVDDFRKANISAAKVLMIINRKPEVQRMEGDDLPPVRGEIEFINVYFKYSTRSEYALQGVSFKINSGQTAAFVGESGCGKTTCLQLIQRFYEIESGQILIDGIDIQTISPYNLRKYISAVPQTPALFSMTIKENIPYGKGNVTDNEISEAAQVGNAHNFVMTLPDNYRTIVQQTSLSGGQKQRICISRAILANTPILLLDEATAALDTESEQLVQESLDKFRKGKTALVVAHRLATVMCADQIFVISNGSVVEEGTHQSLMEKNGHYADLVNFQLQ
jgi:ABC-type multidrug transport system fused ATPase/permease subunit